MFNLHSKDELVGSILLSGVFFFFNLEVWNCSALRNEYLSTLDQHFFSEQKDSRLSKKS